MLAASKVLPGGNPVTVSVTVSPSSSLVVMANDVVESTRLRKVGGAVTSGGRFTLAMVHVIVVESGSASAEETVTVVVTVPALS